MSRVKRLFYVGNLDRVREQVEERLGLSSGTEVPDDLRAGDLVIAEAFGAGAARQDRRIGNVFALCRELKGRPGVAVVLVVSEDDPWSAEIARFCMADGCVSVGSDDALDAAALEEVISHRQRPSTDALLGELERSLASDEGRRASAIQRLLGRERQEWVLETLTDPGTGLFDGPYASFKLDEEFKRAMRFHHPLSLVLLEIGWGDTLPGEDAPRRQALGEAAAVFLAGCRDIDTVARFNETTFLVLLPGTGGDGAAVMARRLLNRLRSGPLSCGVHLDPRAGIATVPASGVRRRDEFLARAEACLRLAQEGHGVDGLCATWE